MRTRGLRARLIAVGIEYHQYCTQLANAHWASLFVIEQSRLAVATAAASSTSTVAPEPILSDEYSTPADVRAHLERSLAEKQQQQPQQTQLQQQQTTTRSGKPSAAAQSASGDAQPQQQQPPPQQQQQPQLLLQRQQHVSEGAFSGDASAQPQQSFYAEPYASASPGGGGMNACFVLLV